MFFSGNYNELGWELYAKRRKWYGVKAAFHYFFITVTHLTLQSHMTGMKLKALSARSVNNYRQSDRQHYNWMYTVLRYDDRQISIKLIHFIAVFLLLSFVWAELNPLTEASDTHTRISGLAGPVHGRSHVMSLLCWFYYIFGQADDTCSWRFFFPSLCVPTRKLPDESFAPKRYCVLTSDANLQPCPGEMISAE